MTSLTEQPRLTFMQWALYQVTLSCGHVKTMRFQTAPQIGDVRPCWSACERGHTGNPQPRHAVQVEHIDDGHPHFI